MKANHVDPARVSERRLDYLERFRKDTAPPNEDKVIDTRKDGTVIEKYGVHPAPVRLRVSNEGFSAICLEKNLEETVSIIENMISEYTLLKIEEG